MSTDYDLIVIGGGAAGLTASGVGASFGARTLMVEQARLGGDCTWYGCVPSKALLSAAHVAHSARRAGKFGIRTGDVSANFPEVIAGVHALREQIYDDADAPEIYEKMGIDVKQGVARFTNSRTIEIASDGTTEQFSARRFIIATGGMAFVPPIKGLRDAPCLTNETIFELTEQPRRLIVLGAGPIGTEMAQAFRRLGSEVTVIDREPRILLRDDEELAGMLRARLEEEGIRYVLKANVSSVQERGDGIDVLIGSETSGGGTSGENSENLVLHGDALLVAAGRKPNVAALNLEAAGVAYDARGVKVDDRCRTSRSGIYAVGDVTGRFAFTHMSEHMAKVAVMNALLKAPAKIDAAHLPWTTYADPELAHVGATEDALRAAGRKYETLRFPYDKIDRAITEREEYGMIKVHARPRDGKILGASILGARGGDLICELALAMRRGISLRHISDAIHPYPSYGLGVRRAADQWYIKRYSPALIRVLKRLFGYRGRVLEYGPDEIV